MEIVSVSTYTLKYGMESHINHNVLTHYHSTNESDNFRKRIKRKLYIVDK